MKEILFKKDESELIKNVLFRFIHEVEHKDKSVVMVEKLIKKFENAEKKIKVSSAKGKGRGLQYWVCDRIAKMFGLEFIQSDDNCLVHSREMGQHGTDIVLRGKVFDDFPFDIECKSCESLSIPEWVRQARANKKENRDWLLVFKKQTIGHEPLVVMEWDTFEKIFLAGRKEKDD